MATDYRTADAMYIDTDTKWRNFVQGFENCILASGGMVVASDTGQLNPATTTRPAAQGLPGAGFRVYRFNDTEQATFPIFMRVDFVIATGLIFALPNVQVGTSTDGAGTINGTRLSTKQQIDSSTAGGVSGALRHFWASGGPGRLAFASGDPGDTRQAMTIVVERMRKLDGSASASGVFYLFGSGQTSNPACRLGVLPHTSFGVNVIEQNNVAGALAQPNPGASVGRPAAGSAICLYPYLIPLAPDWLSIMGLVGAPSGVTVHGGTIKADWMGAERTFMPLNNNIITPTIMDPSNLQGCLLWE